LKLAACSGLQLTVEVVTGTILIFNLQLCSGSPYMEVSLP
jgi:hypothetical protein